MDELDRRLIIELQKDPRQSSKHLAKSVGVVEYTVRRRIENLVSSGAVILTALPNLKMLGYPIRVYMLLEVEHSKFDEIGKQICQISRLGFVSHCIGFTKYYVRGDFNSIESLIGFTRDEIGKIEGINYIETMIECQGLKNIYFRNRISHLMKPVALQFENIGINNLDRRLITQLQQNARMPLKELAQTVGVSQMTIHRHIKDLIGCRTIEFTAIVNIEEFGYPIVAYARMQIKPPKISEVAEYLSQSPQVHYVGIISGATQLLIGIYGLSPQIISDFVTSKLNKIDGVVKIESFSFLDIMKQNFTWLT